MTRRLRQATSGVVIAFALLVPTAAQSPKPRRAPMRPAPAVSAPAPVPADKIVPFRPGETLTYDISWSWYLTAGVATLSVRDKRPAGGSSAYYIVAEGQPTGLVAKLYTVYYKLDTLLDSRRLLPQRGSVYSQEGSRRRTRITIFDQAAARADYEVKTTTDVKTSFGLARDSQDALSAVYALRATPLKPNTSLVIPVCDGGKMYRVQFNVGRTEPVKIGDASVPAFRITTTIVEATGASVGRPMTLWISADARHVPLQLKADLAVGSINLTLRAVPK
jgi:Protein of unknown function (DUF3108)